MKQVEVDSQGNKIVRVKTGETSPTVALDGVSDSILNTELDIPIKANLTAVTMLASASQEGVNEDDQPTESSIRLNQVSKQAESTYEKLEAYRVKLSDDRTKTPAQKVLMLDAEMKKQLQILDKVIGTADLSCRADLKSATAGLFSNNLDLTPLEIQMLPTVMADISKQKTDIGILASSNSMSESKTALVLARDFPHLQSNSPRDGFHELAAMADNAHSLEQVLIVDKSRAGLEAINKLVDSVLTTQNQLDQKLIEKIKGKKV